MPDTQVKDETAAASIAATDRFYIVKDPTGTPLDRYGTPAQMATYVLGSDAEISALSGVTSAANKVPYFTGSGTADVADFTAAGRSMVAAADAAAQTALLNTATSALKGLAPASGGGTTNFLRADLTWAAPSGGGGTPAGADGQIQFNSASSFGATNLFWASNVLSQRNGVTAQTVRIFNTYDGTNDEYLQFGFVSSRPTISSVKTGTGTQRAIEINAYGSTGREWRFETNGAFIGHLGSAAFMYWWFDALNMRSDAMYAWSSSTTAVSGTGDTALARAAAGAVEINNGTAGTLRDLRVRNVRLAPTAVASLVAASTAGEGALAWVNNATATTPRSTVAGGGSNKVLVMSDGTNWLIVA